MDDHAPDPPGVGEADVVPGLAGIGGLVDAVSHDVARTNHPGFAGSGPDRVRIGRRDRERADGLYVLRVEDRFEGLPAVDRLPDAARRRAGVVRVGIVGNAGDGGDAAGARRTHIAESRRLDGRVGFGRALGLGRSREWKDQGGDEDWQAPAARASRRRGVGEAGPQSEPQASAMYARERALGWGPASIKR